MISAMTAIASQRVFFALVPDREATAQLEDQLRALTGPETSRLRWQPESNWHVTLRFVGDTDAACVADLQQLLKSTAPRHPAFTMILSAIETFPSAQRPLVVAATGDAPATAVDLVADLEAGCQQLAFPADERAWRPHMSLARVRGRRPLHLPSTATRVELRVRRICLMRSVATERGRTYVPLGWAALR